MIIAVAQKTVSTFVHDIVTLEVQTALGLIMFTLFQKFEQKAPSYSTKILTQENLSNLPYIIANNANYNYILAN